MTKPLNLLAQKDSEPQFFNSNRVKAAREYQAQRDTEEALRQQEILDKKVLAVIKKAEKENEKAEKTGSCEEWRSLGSRKVTRAAQAETEEVISGSHLLRP